MGFGDGTMKRWSAYHLKAHTPSILSLTLQMIRLAVSLLSFYKGDGIKLRDYIIQLLDICLSIPLDLRQQPLRDI